MDIEMVVRGYINAREHQESFYFMNNIENLASFIYQNAEEDNEIVIDNILGKTLVKFNRATRQMTGRKTCIKDVVDCMKEIKDGKRECVKVEYLDLSDIDGKDEFDSLDYDENQIEWYVRDNIF